MPWRPEPVKVENFSDELWVGVKGKSKKKNKNETKIIKK